MIIKSFLLVLSFTFASISNDAFAAPDLESGIQVLAKQISKNMIENEKKKIAVIEFSNLDKSVTLLGKYLAEELITSLFLISPGQFEVVERSQLHQVLAEHKLSTTGLLDAKAMNKIGKILGVDAIVTGSVTDLDSHVKVNARLVSVSTAKIFAVASTSIPKIGTIAKLMQKQSPTNNSSNISNSSEVSKSKSPTLLENGLSFDLDKCVKKNTQVDCFITLIAVEHDNVITIYGNYGVTKSVIYDDVGTARVASSTNISGNSNRRFLKRNLISGVPNKLKMRFNGVSTAAKKVALLKIKYHTSNNNQSDIAEFRNVTLE